MEDTIMYLENNLQGVKHVGIPVYDIETTRDWYVEKLGYKSTYEPVLKDANGEVKLAFLQLGDMVVELYQLYGEDREEVKTRTNGHIDHFTIDVLDVEKAMRDALQKGASLDVDTPDGPVPNPSWPPEGCRYVFLKSPNGEKVELNQRLDLDSNRRKENLGGWAHLGIPVYDVEKAVAFYQKFGFKLVMHVDIPVGDEAIIIKMVEKNGFILEFYQLVGKDRDEILTRKDGFVDHIALEVLDCQKAFDEMKAAGMEVLNDAVVDMPIYEKGVKYFFIRGPHGEKIEFNETVK
jgi:catechol 2,3-dioxygenase-like lactoylglutathione lyase family enzyme